MAGMPSFIFAVGGAPVLVPEPPQLLSQCCGAVAADELDSDNLGFCSGCHEWAVFSQEAA